MYRMKEELSRLIAEWIITNNKLRELNKYLYENTELFERDKMNEFPQLLYNFFAGKITRFSRDENELYKRMNQLLTKEVNKQIILRR